MGLPIKARSASDGIAYALRAGVADQRRQDAEAQSASSERRPWMAVANVRRWGVGSPGGQKAECSPHVVTAQWAKGAQAGGFSRSGYLRQAAGILSGSFVSDNCLTAR